MHATQTSLKTHVLTLSFIFLFFEMQKRAIVNFTATSWANIIHATQNIYNPYSKNHTSIKHIRPYTFLHFIAPRNEKETIAFFTSNTYASIIPATQHIQSIFENKTHLVTTHTFLNVLAISFSLKWDVRRRAIANVTSITYANIIQAK